MIKKTTLIIYVSMLPFCSLVEKKVTQNTPLIIDNVIINKMPNEIY